MRRSTQSKGQTPYIPKIEITVKLFNQLQADSKLLEKLRKELK